MSLIELDSYFYFMIVIYYENKDFAQIFMTFLTWSFSFIASFSPFFNAELHFWCFSTFDFNFQIPFLFFFTQQPNCVIRTLKPCSSAMKSAFWTNQTHSITVQLLTLLHPTQRPFPESSSVLSLQLRPSGAHMWMSPRAPPFRVVFGSDRCQNSFFCGWWSST